jgi:hypothetical protein
MSPRFEKVAIDQAVSLIQFGGVGRVRTDDVLLAKQVLYQLSYDPKNWSEYDVKNLLVPDIYFVRSTETRGLTPSSTIGLITEVINRLLKKEVIQPQVPLRLPCYDFVPITSLTLGRRLHCWLANALRAKPAFMT